QQATSILPPLNVKTARSWRGMLHLRTLAREGRMTVTIGRRELLAALGGGAAAWPLAARAQQPGKIYRIRLLAGDPSIPQQPAGRAFLDGLRETGLVEGKNVIIERRFTEGRRDRYAEFVAELIRLKMDVIVTSANEATLAAKRANTKIPVVMVNVTD